MMDRPAVAFDHVSKRFCLSATHDSLRDLLTYGFARLAGRGRQRERSTFWALKDVDFRVRSGESIGIIGPNGAGKSTALKLIAGIYRADEGCVCVRGRLAALIEVGAGFHGDLTGRENVFLNGAILGMNRREIRGKLDRIVDFAGIGHFLDEPVKRYSSGMYARLGFSIAAHVDPDVLLVDEVLSVGDAVFRVRCLQRMRELVAGGTSLVFVTHNLEQVQTVCPRAIVLEQGRCTFDGPSSEAIGHYLRAVSQAPPLRQGDLSLSSIGSPAPIELVGLNCRNASHDTVVVLNAGDALEVELTLQVLQSVPRLVVELNLRAASSENVLSFNTGRDDRTIHATPGVQTVSLLLPSVPLAGGQYFWNVRLWDADRGISLLNTPMTFPLMIEDRGRATGRLTLEHAWSLETTPTVSKTTTVSQAASVPIESSAPSEESSPQEGRPGENLLLR